MGREQQSPGEAELPGMPVSQLWAVERGVRSIPGQAGDTRGTAHLAAQPLTQQVSTGRNSPHPPETNQHPGTPLCPASH